MKSRLIKIVRFSCSLVDQGLGKQISFVTIVGLFLKVMGIVGLLFFCFLLTWLDVKSIYELKNYRPPLPSKLLDRKGRLISTYFRDQRIMVEYKKIPSSLIQAFISTEDNHFYEHFGFDLQAVFRAFLANFQSGGIRQGGSTITQQLAKVILTDRSKTYARKLKELFMAMLIEQMFTKQEILNLYFNQIYFGHGNYGVEAASRFYFKKTISEINMAEAAIIASLPSAPNRYSPVRNPHLSMQRLTHVLMKMIDFGYLTVQEAVTAFQSNIDYYQELNISPSTTAYGIRTDQASYFTEYLRIILEKKFGKKKLYEEGLEIHSSLDLDHQKVAEETLWSALKRQSEISRKYIFGKHLQLAGSYSHIMDLIQLSFDISPIRNQKTLAEYQIWLIFQNELLEKAEVLNLGLGGELNLNRFLKKLLRDNPFQNRYLSVQGAFVETDHKTGGLTAMVGGSPFHSLNQINRAIHSSRQPGSTFKALIYASAIESKKITPATIFSDSPVVFLDKEGDSWMPENYSQGYRGFINVREALTHSANMVSIAVAREAKLSSLLPYITQGLGVNERAIPYNLSVALGTAEVTPLQMMKAFSLFPRGGEELPLHFITKIIDSNGKVLEEYVPEFPKRILSVSTATLMTSMLQDVVTEGTGTRVRSEGGYLGFAAGKTGTSQNFRDVWFVGYNNRYTSALWMGYDRFAFSLGPGQAGGNVAAPVWGKYQRRLANIRKKILKNVKDKKKEMEEKTSEDTENALSQAISQEQEFEASYLVTTELVKVNICKITGKRVNPDCFCPEIYEEVFVKDTVPDDQCDERLTNPTIDEATGNIPGTEIKYNDPSVPDQFFSGDDL